MIDACDSDQNALFTTVNSLMGKNKRVAHPPSTSLKDLAGSMGSFYIAKISKIYGELESLEQTVATPLHPPISHLLPKPSLLLTAFEEATEDEPRRISAVSIAERVANERSENLGVSCGYSVRFESVLPRPYGAILYCTVGKIFNSTCLYHMVPSYTVLLVRYLTPHVYIIWCHLILYCW
ncbi:uncharacterized protein LOC112041616 [Lingula anatina]|uniref:Uncharacterized protein LOC112041616 n=1 Tax=Lingula anatina TaxID=7574 RepID=A0A2R2MKU9_LINAN|nr:uncharacterized protein LOC112041616 [Lingula anatina]|eukprot:XP_023930833.1 uncharacterized protein LOC112041616 [Lingula anatina]